MTTTDPGSLSLAFIEERFEAWQRDPTSVSADWRTYFEQSAGRVSGWSAGPTFPRGSVFDPTRANGVPRDRAVVRVADGVAPRAEAPARRPGAPERAPVAERVATASEVSDMAVRQDRVDQLIRAYRVRGHRIATVDPLGLPRPPQPELEPEFYGLTDVDLDRPFSARTIAGAPTLTLRQILELLRETYCGSIGVQFMHIDDIKVKNWLQERMESTRNVIRLTRAEQLRILTRLTDAVIFEEFIQKKYLGAKSFSLEGSESLIPLLTFAIDRAAEYGVDEVVLGMAHRGRLNVLANIMGKSPRAIFKEFEDDDPQQYLGSGDVKYHLGYNSSTITGSGRQIHLSLTFNPSHLEFVNTVVLGRTRAKQDRALDRERERKVALLIHGDAAFAGEGMVQETLNLSQLLGYTVGGCVHVIVNNQIGFTTPPEDGRSCIYATDVAKMLQIPIFHVNGEDPDAVAQVVTLAMDFRATFKQDVVVDMYGYRRHGHNESDEPAFTQPVMYRTIAERPSVRDGYLSHLLKLGEVTSAEADEIAVQRRELLERELSAARQNDFVPTHDWRGSYWEGYRGGPDDATPLPDSGVHLERLRSLMERICTLPPDFHPHKKVERLLAQRLEMAHGTRPLDWGAAELLSLATIATDGFRVRLTGQDVGRGTFSHRHAILHDVEDGHRHETLARIDPTQAPVEIYNSPLSEAGVLGFEYGYSLDCPDGLIMWEAQFGDFVNAAQVIIDQFIVSGEDKWGRLSGLVLLLPHGFEGQGPEHSSARLERFLVLAAEDNIQICQPTTPAQYYHLLRRQVLRPIRKPLVVFTPKSMLRHPLATSTLDECAHDRFHRVIGDASADPARVRRILMCSGKVYYDLAKRRADEGRDDIAIVRVEQLYPLPDASLEEAFRPFADGTPVRWVQDEPENMGAWRHLKNRFGGHVLGRFPLSGVHRPESASPATGSAAAHRLEQQMLLDEAFAG